MADIETTRPHLIEMCDCSCCDGPLGAEHFFAEVCRQAGADPQHGGPSADGVFRVERAECLDVCDAGPILRVDGAEIHKQVSSEEVGRLLDRLRSGNAGS